MKKMSTWKPIVAFAVLLTALMLMQIGRAATVVWTNGAATYWTNVTAWNPNGAPVSANNYVVSGNGFTVQSLDGPYSTFTNNGVLITSNANIYFFRSNSGTGIGVTNIFTNTVASTTSVLTVSNATIKVDSSLGTVSHHIRTPCTFYGTNTISYGNTGGFTVDLYLDSILTGSGSMNLIRSTSGGSKRRDLFLTSDCSGYSGNWTNTGTGAGTFGTLNLFVSHVSGWGGGNVTLNAFSTLTINAAVTNPLPRINLTASTAALTNNSASVIGSLAGVAGSAVALNNSLTLADNSSATFAGTLSGAGGLTKNGTGALTIASVSINGPITNNGGALTLAGNLGALTMANGTTLAPGSAALTAGTLSVGGDLNLNANTLNLDVSDSTGGANDIIYVTGNLNLSGLTRVNLNLTGGTTAPGPYTVIYYSGALNGGPGNLQVIGSRAATFDFSVPNQVNLWFTNGSALNLAWVGDGTTNAWDAGLSFDWFDGTGTNFFAQGDNVIFNDTSTNSIINVAGTVSPGGFTVSNSVNNYVFQGSGVIGGGATLVKSSTGSLTFSNANGFSGGTTISAGSVYARNANSPLGTGTVTLGDANTGTNATALYITGNESFTNAVVVSGSGTGASTVGCDSGGGAASTNIYGGPVTLNTGLILDCGGQTGLLRFNGVISGTGNLTLQGGSRIGLAANNTFSGNVFIQGVGTVLETTGGKGIPSAAAVDVGPGSILADVIDPTFDVLTGSGLVEPVYGSGLVTVGANGGSGTFNGTLADNSPYVLSLAKTGTGTQTLNGPDTATGNTTVNAGTLAVGASGSILSSATITVASGATLDVSAKGGAFGLRAGQTIAGAGAISGGFNVLSNAVVSPAGNGSAGTLTFNNNLTLAGNAIFAFDVSDLIMVGGNLVLSGTNFISMSSFTQQSLTPGTYQLFQYSGTLTGGPGNLVVSPVLSRLTMTVDTSIPGQVNLVVSGSSATGLVWEGGVNGNLWDVATTTNWLNGSNPDVFYQQDGVVFNNVGGANTNVVLNGTLYPSSVTVNSAGNYVFGGAGSIVGFAGLVKSGIGTLTISNANTYTGNTVVNDGTLQLNAGTGAGYGQIQVGNNTLGLNIGAATLTNSVTGSGTINVTETASANTYFGGDLSSFTGNINLPASPGGTAKTGVSSANVNVSSSATINIASGGTFWLNGSSVTVPAVINVSGPGNSENFGALRLDGGATASGLVNLKGGTLFGVNSGSSTISGAITDGGSGFGITKSGSGALTMSGNNSYTGPTIVTNGTVNVTGDESAATGGWSLPFNYSGVTVNFQAGSVIVVSNNAYIQIGSFPSAGTPNNQVINAFGLVTNNGSLLIARGGYLNVNNGAVWVQNGSMTNCPPPGSGYSAYTMVNPGATLIYNGTNTIKLEPSVGNSGAGFFTNAGVVITSEGFERTITTSSASSMLALNGGTIQLSANIPALTSSTLITTGGVLTVQMAAGGGTIDTHGYSTTISNVISGSGSLTKSGNGSLLLPFTNTYTGPTYVNGGTLAVGGKIAPGSAVTISTGAALTGTGIIGGPTAVQGGTLVQPGAGTLTISNVTFGSSSTDTCTNAFNIGSGGNLFTTSLSLYGTNVINILDSSLAVGTYNLVSYSGGIGGNGGTAFVLGTLPAHTAAHLQDSGSAIQLVVTSGLNTTPTNLTASVSSGNLNLSWPADHIGWRLEVQTNNLTTGLSGNWFTWPNSAGTNSISAPLDPANPSVFFRMVYP